MLPKLERLKERHLFNLAFNKKEKKKQRVSSDLLLLYFLFNKKDINKLENARNRTFPKVAFIVGLSIDKKSNKRNLVKRRMRAAYQLVKRKLVTSNIKSRPYVFIWIANPPIKNATFEQIKKTMEHLLVKVQNFEKTNLLSQAITN